MKDDRIILDNRKNKMIDFLRIALTDANVFRFVSAYFTIYGYEVLQDQLHGVEDIRFLFGDPGSVGEVDPSEQTLKGFRLTEVGLLPNEELYQKFLARQCVEWVEKENVKIRSIKKSNFLHGKLYLSESPEGCSAIVGSSNFTKRGLGCGQSSNIEINIATNNKNTNLLFTKWFDDIWDSKGLTTDVKADFLNELKRMGKELSPEFVYFKTLYEIYKEELDVIKDNQGKLEDVHLDETDIWKTLYSFQRDGVKSIIARLLRNNGCILADSVGLGKTYTALGVIKFFELKNERVLVLCPRKLRDNWSLYPVYNNQTSNPFIKDRFNYTLLSHTDLSRYEGIVGGVNLKDFNWSNFDLVVIDESHNFRNDTNPRRDDNNIVRHSRYSRLLEEVIKEGAKTKVLMLSATPVNTSITDLRNQIYLMTEKQTDVFNKNLGLSNIDSFMARVQKSFKSWENTVNRDKQELLESLGVDFFNLLGEISIARSRRQIKEFYKKDIDKIGDFPVHNDPINRNPDTDTKGELSYEQLTKEIENFSLSLYTPSKYVNNDKAKSRLVDQWGFKQRDRERFLIGMMCTNLLKRLESSAYSLTKTLERTIEKYSVMLSKIDQYKDSEHKEVIESEYQENEDEETDDEFQIVREGYNLYFDELDLNSWKNDLKEDEKKLKSVLDHVKQITPERDGKLLSLKEDIKNKIAISSKNKKVNINRKLLVFTTFRDTAEYLYENLRELADDHRIKMAMISGGATLSDIKPNDFNSILTNFAPKARARKVDDYSDEIDLLIGTDCISEGQNLQDCDTVINYDIHWNPIRIIQRFGRVDRIGSPNESVQLINYWPTEQIETYLNLHKRVCARMALVNVSASGDDDVLDPKVNKSGFYQRELTFRDNQLKKLKEEVLDLDELSDGVVMSDFTFDHFFSQLRQYLEKNREELENTPRGVFAVTNQRESNGCSGVIFFLRQTNTQNFNFQRSVSPIYPFYCAYIRYDGEIKYGFSNTKQVLELFDSTATGKTTPFKELCRQLDIETSNGQNMDVFESLLNHVIKNIKIKFEAAQIKRLNIGDKNVIIPKRSDSPQDENNFELVTWLVMPWTD